MNHTAYMALDKSLKPFGLKFSTIRYSLTLKFYGYILVPSFKK